ncbi:MAG TPA: diguanylate cyclase [Noviherbaspirillum sp.]|nr:diguanylate cyclase [Noviherbaspirillum sp.]
MKRSTLQRVLVIPFVILVLSLGGVIYLATKRAGDNASHEFSRTVLLGLSERIGQATSHHLLGAHIAIKAVVPDPVYSPVENRTTALPFPDDLQGLEERLWIATGFFPFVNNYVYFGTPDGRFVGINRRPDRTELRLQAAGGAPRTVYSVAAPGERLGVVRTDNYDARQRPWYVSAVKKGHATWSAVYTDFSTLEPTLTLARPVYRADRSLIGVVATDMALTDLTDFMRGLSVSRTGVAYIVERDGAIIATSSGEMPFRIEADTLRRVMANESDSPLLRESHAAVIGWLQDGWDPATARSREITTSSGSVQIAATQLRDDAGLDWLTVVAVPRADFLSNLSGVLYQSLAIGLAAVFLVLVLGFLLLQWVLRDIRKLTLAAKSIGRGEPLEPLDIRRRDEIGELAVSFQEMERNLRTDHLTGVLNRETLLNHIAVRVHGDSQGAWHPFALLFIDLDGFKAINDTHGHDAGDKILVDVARRLKFALRSTDRVARFGGDEFVVYLGGVSSEHEAQAVAEKIVLAVEEPTMLDDGASVQVGASIGMAFYPADGRDLEAIIKAADTRMLDLKRARKAA